MIRKLLFVAMSACLALVLFPSASASAATVTKARVVGCYTINKPGNYSGVQVAVEGQVTPGYVNGYGSLRITTACARANGVPIVRMHIYHTQLRTVNQTVLEQTSHGASTGSAVVSQKTPHRQTVCSSVLRVYMQVSYRYNDGSYVRPFWVHTKTFTRC